IPIDPNYRFHLGGRECRVNPDGVEGLRVLAKMYRACSSSHRITWALPWRHEVRRIESLNARGVLSLVIERTPSPRMRVLAIWLRGRCGGYIGTSVLANYIASPDFQTRKETARALRRMSGWALLAQMAASDSDARIRRLATPAPVKPYRDRLAQFSSNVQPVPTSPERRNFWKVPSLRVGEGKPPKSSAAIRRLLERIHRLVTGQRRSSGRSSQAR
ncbi:MAG: HEAT repeat domain-containing protein, partial [Aureliella sp.]